MTTESNKRSSRQAKLYADNGHWQPLFEKMRVQTVVLMLAPEDGINAEGKEDLLSFRILLGRSKPSPYMYLAVVYEIHPTTDEITWMYLGPRTVAFCGTHRTMTANKACDPKTWVAKDEPSMRKRCEWDPNEMILSWDMEETEPKPIIPNEQYNQAVIIHKAMGVVAADTVEDD
jgi:hypothetical protein